MLGTQVEAEESDDVGLENSAQIRVDTWRAILKVVTEHPLDGRGLHRPRQRAARRPARSWASRSRTPPTTPTCASSARWACWAWRSSSWLLWRCWALAREGVRRARDRADRQLALGLAAATLALAISCAFGDRFFSGLIAGNFWIACALVDDLVQRAPRGGRHERARRCAGSRACCRAGARRGAAASLVIVRHHRVYAPGERPLVPAGRERGRAARAARDCWRGAG